MRLSLRALGCGRCSRCSAGALFAALAPTAARASTTAGLLSIVNAGDHTALNLTLHDGTRYPLRTLAPLAAGVGARRLAPARAFAGGVATRRRAVAS